MTPYEDQGKIPIGMLVRRVGGFDPYADELKIRYRSVCIGQRGWLDPFCRRAERKIKINIVVRGGGRFDPS